MDRRFPQGAELDPQGAYFRVWAPESEEILIHINSKNYSLKKEEDGYFSLFVEGAKEGDLYQFEIGKELLADPASRYQPQGPDGPSCLVDPSKFLWEEENWKGIPSLKGQVFYEMHVGTFTQEGSWAAAKEKLPFLAELGITVIEMMPVADFIGEFGWGYDGVNLFAPTRLYGIPDDLREFIKKAHQLNIGVILDVVYNHFGPGETLTKFARDFYHEIHENEWGRSINFEKQGVRSFFISNALYWLEEFHFDGLRIDATQNIDDNSKLHILKEINETIRKKIKQNVILIAESESQKTNLLDPLEKKGFGFDAVWNDDFHHTAMVRLTGHREAYYSDYNGSNQELISSLKRGYLYQGQYYKWQKKNRGTEGLHFDPIQFILYLQNHDQIANSTRGDRIHTSSSLALLRAMTLLMILSPEIPLFFQGQEWGATTPFYYFADHDKHISRLVWEGRKQFLAQFPSFKDKEVQNAFPDPGERNNFTQCKLKWEEQKERFHTQLLKFHKDLIRLRREDETFHDPVEIDGAIFTPDIFLLRFFGKEGDDRLILFNFGLDEVISSIPDPLYAPPTNRQWVLILSSENPLYGGTGTPPVTSIDKWRLKGHSAFVFKAMRNS